ncbi:MAG TPA: asparagine synthase (glutamine-hydrolyzing) [Gaiellaceae bacterium]|nr:asparagine synthase (glutamine-hydrolyzing) [Gaiellaceae bacterium]
MCGICGLIGSDGAPDATLADAMNAAIVHRGPDDGSVNVFGRCALAHRRLRVIDLETGFQPVSNETGTIHAVFNGELYEFRRLRAELLAAGHELRGTGDTAVLPHLYEEHGLGFAERLHGMYALALWDAPRERLVLVRDRLGKKPLLWTLLPDGSLAFASELKALLRLPQLERRVDPAALDAYLALGYVPGPATALTRVHKVPPGHLLVWEGGEPRVERYWAPRVDETERTDEEWLALVRETVTAAVRRRLVADVPLGALLSGGIDSSVVVALMAQASSDPVRTFSVGFRDSRYDERALARAVAERWATEHEELLLEPDATEALPRLAEVLDEPFADSSILPTYLVSELARRHVTVALAGDGGDESFGGYERYRAVALARALARVPRPALELAARGARALPSGRTEMRSPAFRAARFLESAAVDPASRYGRLMELFPPELRRELWSDEVLAQLGEPAPAADLLGPPRAAAIRGLQLLDLETYLPGDLLVKADLASMAASLELRAPLLDHTVVELGLSLPNRLKASRTRGKLALRRAFAADLPPQVLDAPKRGFGVPIARWLREDMRELARDTLLDGTARGRGWFRTGTVERLLHDHLAGRADHGARLWGLLALELWQRTHVDRAPAAVD